MPIYNLYPMPNRSPLRLHVEFAAHNNSYVRIWAAARRLLADYNPLSKAEEFDGILNGAEDHVQVWPRFVGRKVIQPPPHAPLSTSSPSFRASTSTRHQESPFSCHPCQSQTLPGINNQFKRGMLCGNGSSRVSETGRDHRNLGNPSQKHARYDV
jgi:hypothetical protein